MNRSIISGKLSRVVILATAFFVFWIYLGSLINFHQHHIFGRTLMSQGILSKREESVEAAVNAHIFPLVLLSDISCSEDLIEKPAELTIFTETQICFKSALISYQSLVHALRGPPAV